MLHAAAVVDSEIAEYGMRHNTQATDNQSRCPKTAACNGFEDDAGSSEIQGGVFRTGTGSMADHTASSNTVL